MMSSNNSNIKMHAYTTYDSSLDAHTTYVQADPSNFRAVVQRLTGSSSSSSLSRPPSDVCVRRNAASFKLHERRQQQQGQGQRGVMRKLDMIKLNNSSNNNYGPMNGIVRPKGGPMVSPVSTLDGLGLGLGSPSPRSSCSSLSMMSEEEERAIICEKGFYLHPTTREFHEPKLLQLFPLHSSRAFQD